MSRSSPPPHIQFLDEWVSSSLSSFHPQSETETKDEFKAEEISFAFVKEFWQMNSKDWARGLKAFGNDLLKINDLQMFPPFGLNLHSYLFVRHPRQQLITLKLAVQERGCICKKEKWKKHKSEFAAIPECTDSPPSPRCQCFCIQQNVLFPSWNNFNRAHIFESAHVQIICQALKYSSNRHKFKSTLVLARHKNATRFYKNQTF